MAARDTPTAARTLTYLPAPIQAPADNASNESFNFLKLAVYTVAQGIFYAYAAKAFFAVSAAIYLYQIIRFSHIVYKADPSKYQEIRSWVIQASLVMISVGVVFHFVSLSYFWSALLIFRSAKRIDCLLPIAQGLFCNYIATTFTMSYSTSTDLVGKRRWVLMEDYVQNYPPAIKNAMLSFIWGFHFSALSPNHHKTPFIKIPSEAWHFVFSHFRSDKVKFHYLKKYLENQTQIPGENVSFKKWAMAIHQLQQLPIQNQLDLGPHLHRITEASTQEQRDQLPIEIKIVLINEGLKKFNTSTFDTSVPIDSETRKNWIQLMGEFEHLDRNQQAILGPELFQSVLRLTDTKDEHGIQISENARLVALKTFFLGIPNDSYYRHDLEWAHKEFKNLSPDLQTDFAAYVKTLKLPDNVFSPEMQALIKS